MSFTDKINADIKSAMIAKNKERLAALRDIKSKLLLEATSGTGEVSEEAAIKIVMKLHKQRIEAHSIYVNQDREDLAADELFQAKVMEEYLPKMMSEEEVRVEVIAAINSTGAKGAQEMGKVMGVLSGKLAGKADGKLISSLVKEELAK